MIERYTRPEMARLWSPQARYEAWLAVELAACEAMEDEGLVPRGVASRVRARARVDADRIAEIEEVTKHDVIAFLSQIEEQVGEDARWLHLGLTSSDVLDTSFAILLTQATDLVLEQLDALLAATKRRALEHKHTPMVGRSHGMHAEPTTFGLALASFHAELQRDRERLERARERIAHGKISGAVGTFANVPPSIEAAVCAELGLEPEPVSTQVVPRDRHAELFSTFAIVGATIERIAVQVRHWQRTEVGEAAEPFAPGQKGSSAMTHKRNPILSENLTGLARMLRGYASAALEDVALWHERDISHSSVERMIGPDATATLHFMIFRCARLIDGLDVYPERLRRNLELSGGIIYSQRLLLDLVRAGVPRQRAYEWVQRNALRGDADFASLVLADADIGRHLDAAAVKRVFDPAYHLRHVDDIFRRVFGEEGT